VAAVGKPFMTATLVPVFGPAKQKLKLDKDTNEITKANVDFKIFTNTPL
jgi:hypothetical protein